MRTHKQLFRGHCWLFFELFCNSLESSLFLCFLQKALFFAAAPEDLGLTEKNGFPLSKPFLPVQTTSARDFRHNQDAKRFFLDQLARAQSVFDLREAHGRGAALREGDSQADRCNILHNCNDFFS